MPEPKTIVMTSELRYRFSIYYYPLDDINACWPWKGSLSQNGYGQINLYGKSIEEHYYVHRISYMLYHNLFILEGNAGLVLHKCPGGGNKACVNPHHLYVGTQNDNIQDLVELGLQLKGETHGMAVLTDLQIIQIREDYKSGFVTMQELANQYKVSKTHISRIINRKSWKHI